MKPEMLLEELGTILSFDRPVTKEVMVQQARDLMLESGFPVGNDFRPTRSTEMVHHVRAMAFSERSSEELRSEELRSEEDA